MPPTWTRSLVLSLVCLHCSATPLRHVVTEGFHAQVKVVVPAAFGNDVRACLDLKVTQGVGPSLIFDRYDAARRVRNAGGVLDLPADSALLSHPQYLELPRDAVAHLPAFSVTLTQPAASPLTYKVSARYQTPGAPVDVCLEEARLHFVPHSADGCGAVLAAVDLSPILLEEVCWVVQTPVGDSAALEWLALFTSRVTTLVVSTASLLICAFALRSGAR